ncbi:Piso0_000258 [Millerozyma farinosa CBS 7064]|uniref:Pre-rRNA-processing protein ESF2 n=1 Tax=Pichia sorbitophila (strain ATCC MYA-4447 / BCRC 22081 / CBS 7064 / NBRC 10061 / NRRL Y-12695) TaxID=559304 RepID=G8YUY5_PICSO|nr:Piso0_000258 [Millerozyma farinosa CBS 7064]
MAKHFKSEITASADRKIGYEASEKKAISEELKFGDAHSENDDDESNESEEVDFDSDEEDDDKIDVRAKKATVDAFEEESDRDDDSDGFDDEHDADADADDDMKKDKSSAATDASSDTAQRRGSESGDDIDLTGMGDFSGKKSKKLKKLSPEELVKEQKRIKKTGVCYLSSIPPYMKPVKLRSILSKFGKIDRLFLKPEDPTSYSKRVKYGGNKKKKYEEGWVEFVNKKDAKLCAATLNGNKIGGKKTSYYYDDILNIKYLSNFKWFDLTQQIARENEIRQAKLQVELSQESKLNKSFVRNVEKSKMINNIQKKRKSSEENVDGEIERKRRNNITQRDVTSTRASASDELKKKAEPDKKLTNVLSKIF